MARSSSPSCSPKPDLSFLCILLDSWFSLARAPFRCVRCQTRVRARTARITRRPRRLRYRRPCSCEIAPARTPPRLIAACCHQGLPARRIQKTLRFAPPLLASWATASADSLSRHARAPATSTSHQRTATHARARASQLSARPLAALPTRARGSPLAFICDAAALRTVSTRATTRPRSRMCSSACRRRAGASTTPSTAPVRHAAGEPTTEIGMDTLNCAARVKGKGGGRGRDIRCGPAHAKALLPPIRGPAVRQDSAAGVADAPGDSASIIRRSASQRAA